MAIGVLGASPISSVMTVGKNEFLSVLQNKPSRSFGDEPSRYYRPYVPKRGILIGKDALRDKVIDFSKGYQFQFNPETINDVKATLYETRPYPGLPYQDYIWSGGGERIISFKLFLDNTPQSHTPTFRPSAVGSHIAQSLDTGKKYGYDETGRATLQGERGYFGKGIVDEISSQVRSAASAVTGIVASKHPTSLSWVNTDNAYSKSRVNERGVLDDVEKIQSFLYPAPLTGETTPKFAEGGVVSMNQFRPPTVAVLSIGRLYLEGIVKSAPVEYTLFDADLTPLRANVDIEFAVHEFVELNRHSSL